MPKLKLKIVRKAARYDDDLDALPERSIILSNTERRILACQRKYLLGVIEGLRAKRRGYALSYGSHYHRVKETVYRAWLRDERPDVQNVAAAMAEVGDQITEDTRSGSLSAEDATDLRTALASNVEAWLTATGGGAPPESYRLVAFEIPLAMPIRGPRGVPFAPTSLMVEEDDGNGQRLRLARPGDQGRKLRRVRWPFWFVGRLDMLLVHRDTGTVWIADDKTSAQPEGLLNKLHNDPQVPSYLCLLRWNVRAGNLRSLGIPPDAPIGGFWHRVTSSAALAEPKPLKAGGFSVAKNQRVPSWRFEAALRAQGIPVEPYQEILDHLKQSVDANIERTTFVKYSQDDLDRFDRELYGDALRIHASWKAAAAAKFVEDLDVSHPRTPVCQLPGGHCEYVGPCLRDGALARTDFEVAAWQSWQLEQGKKAADPAVQPGALGW